MSQGSTRGVPIDVDPSMSNDSDFLVPSQKAVKSFVDSRATGVNTGDETAVSIGAIVDGSSAAVPNDTDLVPSIDSAVVKKITWLDVKDFLKTYFNTLYQGIGSYVPTTRNITINGTTQDLSTDRTWTVTASAAWGGITGTLSAQTDLQTALDGKVDENAAITGATKTKITYDAKGLVTSGADATTADIADSTNKRYVTDADLTKLAGIATGADLSGTNTGDQTSIVGISGTKAQFDTACSDGNFLYVGDVTQYTDEMAQDAVGGMAANSTFVNLTYVDGTPSLTPSLSATGTPSSTTFLRGDNTWAAPTAADPEGWTTIVKSANQDVTNNGTTQDDTDLQFSVVAGGHYMVEMTLALSGNDATGDYKFNFGVSAGTITGDGHCLLSSSTNVAAIVLITASAASTTTTNTVGVRADIDAIISISINFGFYASSNATFSYRFANASAAAGRTSRTWKGSILKYKRLD